MEKFAVATHSRINRYRNDVLCRDLCGEKPFGSRHWEYPWAIEQSNLLEKKDLRILDVAPDFTFPYASFIENNHNVTFIDLEKRTWSDSVVWGADVSELSQRSDFRIMDVRALDFKDELFDVIFCISVLEHIVCPTQNPDHPRLSEICSVKGARPALKEMFRCLKTGGKLVLTVDIYGGDKWASCFENWDILTDIEEAGFNTERIENIDRNALFNSPDTFISQFHGPYITLGFCLKK